MSNTTYEKQLISLLQQNEWFMRVLRAVRECNPPNWLVGGGVIRSIVWDHLHEYRTATPIKDVDVAFYDREDLRRARDKQIEDQLNTICPGVEWEAKNQAAVHLWYERVFGYAVPALQSTEDAIGTWPEPATCVAVRLLHNDAFYVVAPYGLHDLFEMVLRHNPRRVTYEIYIKRLLEKKIEEKWPKTKIITR